MKNTVIHKKVALLRKKNRESRQFEFLSATLLSQQSLKRPFMQAILKDSVELLSACEGKIDLIPASLIRTFHFACACGSINATKYLITAMQQAVKEKRLQEADMPSSKNNRALYYALSSNNKILCDFLIKQFGCRCDDL